MEGDILKIRLELIAYINAFSDLSYQNRVWVDGIFMGQLRMTRLIMLLILSMIIHHW